MPVWYRCNNIANVFIAEILKNEKIAVQLRVSYTKLNNKYSRILIGSMDLDKCYIYSDKDGTFNVRIDDNSVYHYFTINAKGVFFDGTKIN